MNYEDTEVYKLARQMAIELHQVSLDEFPKFELYEQGSQIRRSSKSIVATFVEGYGRRRYPAEHIKFLTYSIASCDETKAHLDLLHGTHSLTEVRFQHFYAAYRKLGGMLYNLRQAVITGKAT